MMTKQVKRTAFFAILITTLLYITSCKKDIGPIIIKPVDTTNTDTLISFQNDIQPIFDNKCTACHNASHPKLNLLPTVAYDQLWTDGSSAPYADTLNPSQSLLYQKVTSTMPSSPGLPNAESDMILKWIEQGAQNN